MRILFMAYDGKGYTGGPIINATRLLPALHHRGHEVCILLPYNQEAPNAAALETEGVICKKIPFPQYTEDLVYWVLREAQEFQPDIFIPNISFQGGFAARWVREAGIPTVIAHRGDNALNWLLARTFAGGDKKWHVNGLMCVSEYLRQQASTFIDKDVETAVIPSGVPPSPFRAAQSGEVLKVVYAGRLEQRQKRVRDMLQAFIWVLSQRADIEFTFIGDGTQKMYLEDEVRKQHLSEKIRFTGRLAGRAYQEELAKHHVIVLMSDYEGIPGSLMDGMVCGLVPVSLRISSIDELVIHRQTGWLINDRKDDFMHALDTLCDTSLRKQLSQNAIDHIQESFSLQATVAKWEAFCERLVKKSATRNPIQVPGKLTLPVVTLSYEGADRKHKTLVYLIHKNILEGQKIFNKTKYFIKKIIA